MCLHVLGENTSYCLMIIFHRTATPAEESTLQDTGTPVSEIPVDSVPESSTCPASESAAKSAGSNPESAAQVQTDLKSSTESINDGEVQSVVEQSNKPTPETLDVEASTPEAVPEPVQDAKQSHAEELTLSQESDNGKM